MNSVAAAMAAALEKAGGSAWITVPSDPAPVQVIDLQSFDPEEWL